MASNLASPRCINGQLVRPTPPSDDSPSTACQASTVCAPAEVTLGKAAPGFGACPGIVPSRRIPPPPHPSGNAHLRGEGAGFNSLGGGVAPGGGPPGNNPGSGRGLPGPPPPPPGSTPPQQTAGASNPGSTPPTTPPITPPITPPSGRTIDLWASLDRSRNPLPKLSLLPNYNLTRIAAS